MSAEPSDGLEPSTPRYHDDCGQENAHEVFRPLFRLKVVDDVDEDACRGGQREAVSSDDGDLLVVVPGVDDNARWTA